MDLKRVCRCCLSGDCYKELSNEYYFNGKNEVYSKMISETFNLNIGQQKEITNLICEECILKLRDASVFKKKVIETENVFFKHLQEKAQDSIEPDLKQEFEDLDDNFDFEDRIDDDFVWDVGDSNMKDEKGQIFVIKLEPKIETFSKTNEVRTPKKSTTQKSRRINVNELIKKTMTTRSGVKKKIERNTNNTENKSPKRGKEKAVTSQNQLASRENSLKLVLNSNMCLFKSLKTKYGCFHCKSSFMTISELREHTKTHSSVNNLKIRFNLLKGLSYKNVEISNLTCNLCSEKCPSLNDLRNHLAGEHEFDFKDGGHFLIPYNLESEFKCVLCDQNFNTFTRLSIHMNSHYKNNVCEICGVSYINRLSLRMHVSSVHKEKKCSHCSLTFLTHYSKVKHMRKSHNIGISKRYCLLCDKTFRYSYLLMEHKIQEHGAKRQLSNCPECNKTFLSPQNLKIHIRSVHIKERNYPCSLCGMRFFTKCDQRRHEKTHEDVRSFSCSYCEGKFKSKDSWRRHLKRQHGHLYDAQ